MEEREIICLSQRGDKEAFSELVKKYHRRVFQLAYSFTRNRETADDISQEVFVKAYFALPKFRFRSEFSTWIYRIAMNHIMDYIRKRRVKILSLDDVSPDFAVQEDETLKREKAAEEEEKRKVVFEVLQSLPLKYRMIITLRDIQGFSYEEISQIMGVSPGTVDSRLHRARKMLKDKVAILWQKKE